MLIIVIMKNITRIFLSGTKSLLRAVLLCGSVIFVSTALCVQTYGNTSPSWSVTSHSGREIHSTALGKVTVVNFWATWCIPCIVEIPTLQDLSKKYQKDGLTVVGVSVDAQSQAMLQAYVEKFKMNYAVALANPEIMNGFRVSDEVPMTFILDQQGRVLNKHVGYVKKEELEKDIRSALKL